jgi:hypothetical protein
MNAIKVEFLLRSYFLMLLVGDEARCDKYLLWKKKQQWKGPHGQDLRHLSH